MRTDFAGLSNSFTLTDTSLSCTRYLALSVVTGTSSVYSSYSLSIVLVVHPARASEPNDDQKWERVN
jgi:hypothetical protein